MSTGKELGEVAAGAAGSMAAREKAKRIGLGTLRAFGRAFGPDNRAGSLGQDWLFFSEKD